MPRVLVTGASGLIGTALTAALAAAGDEPVPLRRGPQWEPEQGQIDRSVLDGVDAVVHLAGAGIGDHRWTAEHRRRVYDSRANGTRALAEAIAATPSVQVFVSGSAVGFYGDAGDRECTEDSPPGEGFLTQVVTAWEGAAQAAADSARTVLLRTGIVLSPKGGALGKQLPLFKLGVGGRLGAGTQWQSWIHVDDEVAAIRHALAHDGLHGPVNATSPHPVTNAEFTKALGRALRRPTVMAAPAFALKAAFGRAMAEEMLLAGQRVLPTKLLSTGFQFEHPDLDEALKELVAR